MAIAAGAAVGIAIVIAAIVCYAVVRMQLRGQVDDALRAQAAAVERGDFHSLDQLPGLPPSLGGPAQYIQVLGTGGLALGHEGDVLLPVSSHSQAVANGNAAAFLTDARVASGSHLRVITFAVPPGVYLGNQPVLAIQLGRPLDGIDRILSRLRLFLLLLCALGVALAAALGRLAARRVLAPLAEVAQTAEHITETEDLSSRIHVHADDEVGQLATRFNAMLERLQGSRAALDDSVRAQRQLVADASHELRTPVTSLRTNIEVLLAGGALSEEDRRRLLADVVEQSEELSALVSDLIELARGDLPISSSEDARFDRIVADSVSRARRNYPEIAFDPRLEPTVVEGVPERLGRAANNLLDNAARHSAAGAAVEITVDESGLTVRDHGTGIAEEDLPYVFDRFFRGANSRARQGSGLGLAIVRQVALQHGGSVSAANAPGGGACFTMRLPLAAANGSLDGEGDEARALAAARPLSDERP
jgi:two-component system sensor histidine kinase MprB